jgi:peptidoglycan hydrolase-like protein with peptidoglycan-binding domain
VAAAVALAAAGPAAAMQFEPMYLDGGAVLISATGPIFSGDKHRLEALIDSFSAGDHVIGIALDSPGGEIDEANAMAGVLQETGWPAAVLNGSQCASACFLLFVAAKQRYVEGDALVGVHSASDDGNETTYALAATTQMARDAAAFGVPAGIIGKMVTTEPGRMAWLTPADLRSLEVTILADGGIEALVAAAPAPDGAEMAASEGTDDGGPGNDLLSEDDAIRVQRRLADLGYAGDEGNGVWGWSSRVALRAFKIAHGLPADDIYDRGTERLLFSTRAQHAAGAIAAPPDWQPSRYPPPAGATLNPLNAADAVRAQERLAELGYLYGPADGVWDSLSRRAVRDFVYVNGLDDTAEWDAGIEEALLAPAAVGASATIVGLWSTDPEHCDRPTEEAKLLQLGTWGLVYGDESCSFDSVDWAQSRWTVEGVCSWRDWTTTHMVLRRFGSGGLEASALDDRMFHRCGAMPPSAARMLRK